MKLTDYPETHGLDIEQHPAAGWVDCGPALHGHPGGVAQ
jgi:hypothetical protein